MSGPVLPLCAPSPSLPRKREREQREMRREAVS
jgi:hypothetical protein